MTCSRVRIGRVGRIGRIGLLGTAAALGVVLLSGCSGTSGTSGIAGSPSVAASPSPSQSPSQSPSPSASSPASATATPTQPPSTGTPTPTATKTTVAECRTANLRFSVTGSDGAMGSLYTHIVITNRGLTACATGGFGGVSHVAGADGHQVGSAAKRDPDHKVARFVLQPGQRAVATLQEPEPVNYPKARCLPVQSTGLRIYPPNETHSAFVSRPAKVCSKKSAKIFLQPYVKKG